MNYVLLAILFVALLILFIGGILPISGQAERRMERFSHKTKREILAKMKGKV